MANAKGIDISKWQTTTPDLTGRSFVVARATWQTTKDIRFDMHARNVLAKGRVLGAYHFGTGDATSSAQGAAFLKAVGSKASFLVLDLERNAAGSNMSLARARNFITYVKAHDPLKRKVGLYHSASGWPSSLGQDFNWIAHWGVTEPGGPSSWKLHQYRGSPLDLDQFNGTTTEMRAYFKMPSAPVVVPTPEPVEPPPPTYTQAQLEAAIGEAEAAAKAEADALRVKINAAIVNLNEALADLA